MNASLAADLTHPNGAENGGEPRAALVLAIDAYAVAAHARGHLTGPVLFAAWIVS